MRNALERPRIRPCPPAWAGGSKLGVPNLDSMEACNLLMIKG